MRFASISAALTSLAVSANACERDFDAEWAMLSSNGSKTVYNVGIGSLLNWASQQINEARFVWPANQTISPLRFTTLSGVRREIRGCWRYQSARAVACAGEPGEFCPPMLGAYFEVKREDWESLRDRECSYDLLPVEPDDDDAPAGNYFTWSKDPDAPCPSKYDIYPDQISQAYFDAIIGGILSWDGQLTNSGRYTWDVAAEMAFGSEEMAARVFRAPSLSWEERYDHALEWVRTTAKSEDLPWMNDRPCAFTGNSATPMTPVSMLGFEHDPYGDTPTPEAVGAAAPIVSQEFYDLVDRILIEGGWAYDGASNTIDERYYPCDVAAEIGIERTKFSPNEFYNDVKRWRSENDYAPPSDNEFTPPPDKIKSARPASKIWNTIVKLD